MGYLSNVYPKFQAKEILLAHFEEVAKLILSQFPYYLFQNQDIEDIYLHLLEKVEGYNSESALSTFIVTYAKQYLLNKQSRKKIENKYIDYRIAHHQETEEEDIIFNIEYKEMKNVLYNIINHCPNIRNREILQLHFQQSYSAAKIAKLTNLSLPIIHNVIGDFVRDFKLRFSEKGENYESAR